VLFLFNHLFVIRFLQLFVLYSSILGGNYSGFCSCVVGYLIECLMQSCRVQDCVLNLCFHVTFD